MTARKKLGPKSTAPQKVEVRKTLSPKVFVAFYFEDKHGNSGFDNVSLSNIYDLRTENDILTAMVKIKECNPEPDFYQRITIINWRLLEM